MGSNYRNMLVNLDVLSKVEKLDKLCTCYKIFYREKAGFYTWLSRRYRLENKDKSIEGVETLINTCFLSLERKTYQDKDLVKLIKYIMDARQGLLNLKYTYSEHDDTVASLRILLEIIDDLPTNYPDLYAKYLEKYNVDNIEFDEIEAETNIQDD